MIVLKMEGRLLAMLNKYSKLKESRLIFLLRRIKSHSHDKQISGFRKVISRVRELILNQLLTAINKAFSRNLTTFLVSLI